MIFHAAICKMRLKHRFVINIMLHTFMEFCLFLRQCMKASFEWTVSKNHRYLHHMTNFLTQKTHMRFLLEELTKIYDFVRVNPTNFLFNKKFRRFSVYDEFRSKEHSHKSISQRVTSGISCRRTFGNNWI